MKSEYIYDHRTPNPTLVETRLTEEDLSSVSLTISAKGIVQPEVKVYNKDAQKASEEAQKLLDDLIIKYKIKLSVGE